MLREGVASGVNHVDTSDFYGPHVTNEIIAEALRPYQARRAQMAELVDALVSGASGASREGSSPFLGTILQKS